MKNTNTSRFVSYLLNPIIAVIIAFIMGGLVVAVSGGNPLQAYKALFIGSFGSWSAITRTIRFTLPIIMLGLSFAVCERSGYFNIGQEGQMYAASIGIAFAQYLFRDLPDGILLIIMLAAAILLAGLICFIPALLKTKIGTDEVIIAMLLNYILVLLTNYLLLYSPIAEKGKSTALSIEITPRS